MCLSLCCCMVEVSRTSALMSTWRGTACVSWLVWPWAGRRLLHWLRWRDWWRGRFLSDLGHSQELQFVSADNSAHQRGPHPTHQLERWEKILSFPLYLKSYSSSKTRTFSFKYESSLNILFIPWKYDMYRKSSGCKMFKCKCIDEKKKRSNQQTFKSRL